MNSLYASLGTTVFETMSRLAAERGAVNLGQGFPQDDGPRDILEAAARQEGPGEFMVTLGYAGWGPGQLEDEILRNGWLTVDAKPEIIFEKVQDYAGLLNDPQVSAASRYGIQRYAVCSRGLSATGVPAGRKTKPCSCTSGMAATWPTTNGRFAVLASWASEAASTSSVHAGPTAQHVFVGTP